MLVLLYSVETHICVETGCVPGCINKLLIQFLKSKTGYLIKIFWHESESGTGIDFESARECVFFLIHIK